jgi:hypothetical protein
MSVRRNSFEIVQKSIDFGMRFLRDKAQSCEIISSD